MLASVYFLAGACSFLLSLRCFPFICLNEQRKAIFSKKSYVIFIEENPNIASVMLADVVIALVKGKSKSYFRKLLDKDIYSSREINANIKDKISLKCIFKKSFLRFF